MSTSPTEAITRKHIIDRRLAQAGWSVERGNLTAELPLAANAAQVGEAAAAYRVRTEWADYALLRRDGQPIALVEAKRSSRDALAGQRQAADYADRVRAQYGVEPFIFLTNGAEIWFWDRLRYPPRKVSGFFRPEDMERLAFQREYHAALSSIAPNGRIAGRPFQMEAIRRLTEAMESGQRNFLLVMATGTGKTRTVIGLVDVLMRARWVQRVLFLADRRELVRQALGDFKEHLPNETRARVEGGEIDHTARIHVATYPSMMQVYQQLSPSYYDLIIADESHRSVYNRYKALLDYFDAMELGLTATPTDYIDHNTFELFQCADGLPTFYYPYETAVDEGYLVNYRVLEAQTAFQLQGIKAGQLPAELQRQLEAQGIDLGDINFEGTDLERRVTNTGTNDALVREFMAKARKDATGTLPAKSIIFAMSHQHAVRLWESFNRLYPDLQRRGFAQVIDSQMERADASLDDFKRKDMPRVAISVDMLDTGIDVPAIQNLVFAKPVFSQVKFWQMIGRGTRLWHDPETGEVKRDFLIIDHWNNFAYFNMNPEGEVARPTEPLPVRLFRLRLEKLALLRGQGQAEAAAATVGQLQAMLAQTPTENVNVRAHGEDLAKLGRAEGWDDLDPKRMEWLNHTIAPLLRFTPDVSLPIMTFEVRTERLAVAYLKGERDVVDTAREGIINDLQLLPPGLREVQAQAEKLAWVGSDGFWLHLDYARIMEVQATFAPLMRYRERQRQTLITLHLPDEIASRRWILYGPSGEGAFADTYRERVEAHVKALADEHPTLHKLKQGEPLGEEDIEALAGTLDQADLFITEDTLREVYGRSDARLVDFLRHILGGAHLPSREQEINAQFDEFIGSHRFTASQIAFLRAVRSHVVRRARLTRPDLDRPPFTRIGPPDRLFTEAQLAEVLDFANQLIA